MINLHLLFNKLYYDKLGASADQLVAHFEQMNRQIGEATFSHTADYTDLPLAHDGFLLETVYPGLLAGTGAPHGHNQCKEELNMGFSFDYVSGQPFIPGSTVKGSLRHCFTEYPEEVARFADLPDLAAVKALESETFENGDVFLDAVVYDGDAHHRVVGFDSLAPHRVATENPISLSFIKLLPGVKLSFRFLLSDGMLTARQKCELFKELLKTFGIGSKTNVGYGILDDCDASFHGDTPTAAEPDLSAHPSAPSVREITMKVCPHCGRRNFKYRRIDNVVTDQVNWNWTKNICFGKDCGRSLE